MPNSGDSDGAAPLGPVGTDAASARVTTDTDAADGSAAASGVGDVTDPAATTPAPAAGPTPATGSTDAIAAGLAEGSLDVAAARTQLIEQAVAAQLPAGAAPETVAAVRAEVEALLEADPLLEQLLRP